MFGVSLLVWPIVTDQTNGTHFAGLLQLVDVLGQHLILHVIKVV